MTGNNTDFITFKNPQAERFAVILAGGDGVRLREVTKKLTGCKSPKQFCTVLGDEPLLTVTQKRIVLKISPEKTFPAILYTLLRLSKLHPQASVAFFPSGHYVSDEAILMNRIEAAFPGSGEKTGSRNFARH